MVDLAVTVKQKFAMHKENNMHTNYQTLDWASDRPSI